ncbi:MAG: hypothetical protein AB8B52_06570 [Winogradskyella sp.]|uniref:hypothetical protein n=1 Tax=Winogradskyella sp. TaxID=1883156 RepID=UPI00385B6F62
MTSDIIISESDRPLWQILIAAFFFTLASALIIHSNFNWATSNISLNSITSNFEVAAYLTFIGIVFCFKKSIHVDLIKSKFRPTFGLGPLHIGQWQTIKNYQYVSVFRQLLKGGSYTYEVNLWYDNNKHFELYEEDDYTEAFMMGFELSEELNIDLLDATLPNDFKWVDKTEWKAKMSQKRIE